MARLTNEQRVLITVEPLTDAGNPAPIDGPVVFASSDEAIVRIEQVDDRSAYVVAVAASLQAALVTATFDADLGAGVRSITASEPFEVVQAEATRGVISVGPVELTPATP